MERPIRPAHVGGASACLPSNLVPAAPTLKGLEGQAGASEFNRRSDHHDPQNPTAPQDSLGGTFAVSTKDSCAVPRTVQSWPQDPRSVSLARGLLHKALNDWGLAELAEAAELVLSELMTNALRHAQSSDGGIRVSYEPWVDGGVHLEVHDGDAAHQPLMRNSNADAEHGRGLQLVHNLTSGRWGTKPCPGRGKCVWANVPAC